MKMPSLTIGRHTALMPVIQGGMGVRVSLSGLAAAVANAGGIGVISSSGIGLLEPDAKRNYIEANIRALSREIRTARANSSGPIGVNIMGVLGNYASMVETSIEEDADLIFSGAGLPLDLPAYRLKASEARGIEVGTALVPIVSSARAARIIAKKWLSRYSCLPDAFVVEGPLAGGHLGFKPEELNNPEMRLENIVAEVLEAVKEFEDKAGRPIPVVGGGGLHSGADICRLIRLGASGVQMGTRFVATTECDASPSFKASYINSSPEDVVIIKSPVGLPGRALKNSFIENFESQKPPFKCIFHCITTCFADKSPYCIAGALLNAVQGQLEKGFAFCGAQVAKIKEVVSVAELMESLRKEFELCEDPQPA
ncbi:nitronate monooxygenase family protein [Desulfovibrio sp. OttesenSCG-928-C14]|nr:nitronate monooxygenase family protein [Desulfovibrio sp. OttesenSCG-928-C14]